jgi:methyl-accepting chemotaxis protein
LSGAACTAKLLEYNRRISNVVENWQGFVSPQERNVFDGFSKRIAQFQKFRSELARLAVEAGPSSAREWGDNDANRSVRIALNRDVEELGAIYAARSKSIFREIDESIESATHWLAMLALLALALAMWGAGLIWRSIAQPLAHITAVTTKVAKGEADIVIPYLKRSDEIGALAHSINVFQEAMRRNEDFNRTAEASQLRELQQQKIEGEIAVFSQDIETTLAELAWIASATPIRGIARYDGFNVVESGSYQIGHDQ